MKVCELTDDIATSALGECASHAGVTDPVDKAEVDTVVDPPGFEKLVNHVHLLSLPALKHIVHLS